MSRLQEDIILDKSFQSLSDTIVRSKRLSGKIWHYRFNRKSAKIKIHIETGVQVYDNITAWRLKWLEQQQ